MIAARLTQGTGFRVEQVPEPRIGSDELLLRIEATSICATDLKMIRSGNRKLRDGQTITLGHEFVGAIAQVGSEVAGYAVGGRVGVAPNWGCGNCRMCLRGMANMCPNFQAIGITCDGSHAQFMRVPGPVIRQGNVISIPADVSPIAASLAEPLSCAVSGVRNAQIGIGDVVVVYGMGPMGLLCLMLAARQGASQVIGVDVNDFRLKAAMSLGATGAVNSQTASLREYVAKQTQGQGADVVILATPVAALQVEALEVLAAFGRLCLFAGWAKGQGGIPLDTNPIHYKNLIVTGMSGGCNADYLTAMRLIVSGAVDVARVASRVLPLARLTEAYELAGNGKELKVVVTPDGTEAVPS